MTLTDEIKVQKVIRVAIYIRVSTRLQEDRYSLSAQLHELTKYANSQNWEIVNTFRDVDSGAKFDKAGLEALLDCVEDGLVDVVLVVDQDRLSRLDTVDWELLKDVLRENRVKIAEPGNIVDLENEDQEFMSDLKNLIAKRERRSIKRRTGRGLRQYTREGKLWGRQPDEYILDKSTKTVSINEEYAWLIPYIDKLYIEENYGIQAIATKLNQLCKTPNGGRWAYFTVLTKLTCKAYHGVLERSFSNGEVIQVDNVYPTLRTKETYELIQRKLNNKTGYFPSKRKSPHPLARIRFICADCGRALMVHSGSKTTEGLNTYLAHAWNLAEPCKSNPRYNTHRIIKPLTEAVKGILTSPKLASQYLDLEFEDEDKLKVLEKEANLLQKSIAANNEKLDELLDLYLDKKWSKKKHLLDEKHEAIEAETETLNLQLTEISRKIELVKDNKYNYESFMSNMSILEEHLAMIGNLEFEYNDQDKEELFGTMFESAVVHPEQNEIVFKLQLAENMPLEAKVKIDEQGTDFEERLRNKQYERYLHTQQILDRQEKPIGFNELKRLTGLNAQTLRADENLFGPYRNLKLGKNSSERKEKNVAAIREMISVNPKVSSYVIAEKLGISQGTALKYIKEFNLR